MLGVNVRVRCILFEINIVPEPYKVLSGKTMVTVLYLFTKNNYIVWYYIYATANCLN